MQGLYEPIPHIKCDCLMHTTEKHGHLVKPKTGWGSYFSTFYETFSPVCSEIYISVVIYLNNL